MNSVPFAFCDAVASTLGQIHPLDDANSAEWSLWKSVFVDHSANRLNLCLRVLVEDGKWSYELSKPSASQRILVDLEEVQEAHRKYVYPDGLVLSNGASNSESSVDEIRSILEFLRPCVRWSTWLWLYGIKAPKEVIAELLSPFSLAPFCKIILFGYKEAFEDLLSTQIALDSLQKLEVYDYCPRALELEAAFKTIQSERRG